MKIISELTNKYYDTTEECLAAEAEYKKKEEQKKLEQQKKADERKADAEKVNEAKIAYNAAKEAYNEALVEFCKKHGSYHYTVNEKDIADIFNDWFGWI